MNRNTGVNGIVVTIYSGYVRFSAGETGSRLDQDYNVAATFVKT